MEYSNRRTAIIVNPRSGHGKALDLLNQLRERYPGEMAGVEVRLTSHPGHGTSLAYQIVEEGFDRLVVCGGDGTWSEVANGIFTPEGRPLNPDLVVSFLPGGSGSDLLRSRPFSEDSSPLKTALMGTKVFASDILRVRWKDLEGKNHFRIALNSVSAGISGFVASARPIGLPLLPPRFGYLASFLRHLWDFPPLPVTLSASGQLLFRGDLLNLFVCNGSYSGGGMRWSPDARLDDGFADLLLVEPVRWIRIPAYVPLLFKGRIHRIPEARSFRSDSVQAEFGHAACFEMDGEVFRGVALTIEVVPKALRVLAG